MTSTLEFEVIPDIEFRHKTYKHCSHCGAYPTGPYDHYTTCRFYNRFDTTRYYPPDERDNLKIAIRRCPFCRCKLTAYDGDQNYKGPCGDCNSGYTPVRRHSI